MARGETHILVGPSVASEYRYQVTVECRAPSHCAARGYRYRTANLYHDEWLWGACITASNLGCRLDYRCMAQRKHMSSEVSECSVLASIILLTISLCRSIAAF